MMKKCLWISAFCFLFLPIIGQTKEVAMEHQTDLVGEVVIQKGNRMQDTVKASSARLCNDHHGSHSQVKKPVRLRIKDPQGDLVLNRVYDLRINYSKTSPEDVLEYDRYQVFTVYCYLHNPSIWLTEKEVRVWLKAMIKGIEAQGWKRKTTYYADKGYTAENVPLGDLMHSGGFGWETENYELVLAAPKPPLSEWMQPKDLFLPSIILSVKK